MFSQTSMTNRRQFLERSALGFGSAFLLPSLLASCTDHVIDPSNPPIIPPVIPHLGDYQIDWNDDVKIVVVAGLEMIPEVGEILGPLVDIFWPSSKEDVWGEIKAQVEALIRQEIDQSVYQQVSNDLEGLKGVTTNYLNALKNYNDSVTAYQKDPTKPKPDPSDVRTNLIYLRNNFSQFQPHFQSSGYELLLLPLFAQFVNMYLSTLRDAATHGIDWGMAPGDQQQAATDLTTNINTFYDYTLTTYFDGRNALIQKTQTNYYESEPFRTVNKYDRQMSQTVLYFMDVWPFYDVTKWPNGIKAENIYRREIYSDPFGSTVDSGPIVLTTPFPSQFPTQLSVWAFDRIDAVQLTYPQGSGPGGVTTTPRMGDQNGGTNQSPHGGSFNLSPDNPITQVRAIYDVYQAYTGGSVGPVVTGMQFQFYDGTVTDVFGNQNLNSVLTRYDTGLFGYANEALSSIYINGVNKAIGSADCVVFGFQYWQSPAATLNALRAIYVRSPKERSAADFAKALPNRNIPADLITEDLKAARQAYWEYMKARAK